MKKSLYLILILLFSFSVVAEEFEVYYLPSSSDVLIVEQNAPPQFYSFEITEEEVESRPKAITSDQTNNDVVEESNSNSFIQTTKSNDVIESTNSNNLVQTTVENEEIKDIEEVETVIEQDEANNQEIQSITPVVPVAKPSFSVQQARRAPSASVQQTNVNLNESYLVNNLIEENVYDDGGLSISWDSRFNHETNNFSIYLDGYLVDQEPGSFYYDDTNYLLKDTQYEFMFRSFDKNCVHGPPTYFYLKTGTDGQSETRSQNYPEIADGCAGIYNYDPTKSTYINEISFVKNNDTSITFTWNASQYSGFQYYKIYKNGILVGVTSNNQFIDDYIESDKTYEYYFKSVDNSCRSNLHSTYIYYGSNSYQNIGDVNNPEINDICIENDYLNTFNEISDVNNLNFDVSGNNLILKWNYLDDIYDKLLLNHYRIYDEGNLVRVVNKSDVSNQVISTTSGSVSNFYSKVSYVDNNCNEGKPSFIMRGNGANSGVEITSSHCPTGTNKSNYIDNIKANIVNNKLVLNWNYTEGENFSHYNIYKDNIFVARSSDHEFNDSLSDSSLGYDYKIKAIDSNCNEITFSEMKYVGNNDRDILDTPLEEGCNFEKDLELSDVKIEKSFLILTPKGGINYTTNAILNIKNNGNFPSGNFNIRLTNTNKSVTENFYFDDEILSGETKLLKINYELDLNDEFEIEIDSNDNIVEFDESNNLFVGYYDSLAEFQFPYLYIFKELDGSNRLQFSVKHFKNYGHVELYRNGNLIDIIKDNNSVVTIANYTRDRTFQYFNESSNTIKANYEIRLVDDNCRQGPPTSTYYETNRSFTQDTILYNDSDAMQHVTENPCAGIYQNKKGSINYITGLKLSKKLFSSIELTWERLIHSDFDHYNIYKDGKLVGITKDNVFTDNYINNDDAIHTYNVTAVSNNCKEGAASTFLYWERGGEPSETGSNPVLVDTCKAVKLNQDISISNISVGKNIVSFDVTNEGQGFIDTFEVLFLALENSNIVNNKTFVYNGLIKENVTQRISVAFDMASNQEIFVQLDPNNNLRERTIRNNIIRQKFYSNNVYLNIDTKPSVLNKVYLDYIKNKLIKYNVVDSEEKADYIINVDTGTNSHMIVNQGWGYKARKVVYHDKKENYPFTGLINSFQDDKVRIFVLGNAVEGMVSALREFDYDELENNKDKFIGKNSLKALSTFDYFSIPENRKYYLANNQTFANIVRLGLLGGYNFKQELVRSNDLVELRLKHIEPQRTQTYASYLDALYGDKIQYSEIPVVMAGGLWNNISYWEKFGEQLAANGRDVWLAEITGGPGTECGDCPNYNFDDLTDKYWPAIIAGVQAYTGQSQVQYVGFSNGARTALSALEKWNDVGISNAGYYWDGNNWIQTSLPTNPVETLVAVGSPGAFEGGSLGKSLVVNSGAKAISNLGSQTLNHISFIKLISNGLSNKLGNLFSNDAEMISLNLFKDYFSWMSLDTDSQPGNFQITSFASIRGYLGDEDTSDGIVTKQDVDTVYDSIQSQDKHAFKILGAHSSGFSFPQKDVTKDIIERKLNGEDFKFLQRCFNLEKQNEEVPIC